MSGRGRDVEAVDIAFARRILLGMLSVFALVRLNLGLDRTASF